MDIIELHDWASYSLAHRPNPPLLLVVTPDVAELRLAAAGLAEEAGWPLLDVGAVLSADLLDVPAPQRPNQVDLFLRKHVSVSAPGPVVATELDLLFHPTLHLDPLALLRQTSRHVPIVAFWPGKYHEPALTYGIADHHHYRLWPSTGLADAYIQTL